MRVRDESKIWDLSLEGLEAPPPTEFRKLQACIRIGSVSSEMKCYERAGGEQAGQASLGKSRQ